MLMNGNYPSIELCQGEEEEATEETEAQEALMEDMLITPPQMHQQLISPVTTQQPNNLQTQRI